MHWVKMAHCVYQIIVYNLNPFSTMSSYECLWWSQRNFLLWISTLLEFLLSKDPFADCFHVNCVVMLIQPYWYFPSSCSSFPSSCYCIRISILELQVCPDFTSKPWVTVTNMLVKGQMFFTDEFPLWFRWPAFWNTAMKLCLEDEY